MTSLLAPATPALLEAPEAREVEALLARLAESLWEARGGLQGGLSSGPAGVALFLGHLSRRRGFEGWREPALRLLEAAVEGIGSLRESGLYAGYTGVAWAVEHLQAEVFGREDGEDPNAEVDEVLVEHLKAGPWSGSYDLVSGLVGLGVYGLARVGRPSGRAVLKAVLAQLERRARPSGPGLAWASPAEVPPGMRGSTPPAEQWNLGVAHGIPGVLGLVAGMAAEGIGEGRALRLYEGGMSWLRAHLQPAGTGSRLAAREPIQDGPVPPRRCRVAWCYGDLGASVVLLAGARRLGRPEDEALALELARCAAARPLETSSVLDACLCHGSLGNAHLFHRLHRMTGEAALADVARTYLRDGLARRRPGQGFAGFHHHLPAVEGYRTESVEEPSAGLLEGAAGLGLALLSALEGRESGWDGFLLPG